MKKVGMLLCALLVVVMIAGCSGGRKGKVLVEINGTKVTEGDLEFLGTLNPRIQAQTMTPDGKQRILDNLVEQELLYQDAIKKGINRDPEVKAKVDLYRRVIIAQSLVDDEIEKAAKKYYDEHADEFKKLKLSQIMIKYTNPADLKKGQEASKKKGAPQETSRSEEEALNLANSIKARLDKGEDFATVAKEVSDDVVTKNRGGDLGPAAKGDMRFESRGLGPLLEKAFEMKVGEISGPIKTNQGYHIIAVTEGVELQPFDDAKASIVFKLRNDTRNTLLANLKKDAKIKYPGQEKAVAEQKAAEKPAEGTATAEKKEGAAAPAAEGPTPPAEVKAEKGAPATGTEKPIEIKEPEVKKPEIKQIAKEAVPKKAEKPESAVKKAPAPEKKQ